MKIPSKFIQLCKDYYCGSNSMMCAIASTGELKPGSICPTGVNSPEEWMVVLLSNLANEACAARIDGEQTQLFPNDWARLKELETWADEQHAKLIRKHFPDFEE